MPHKIITNKIELYVSIEPLFVKEAFLIDARDALLKRILLLVQELFYNSVCALWVLLQSYIACD